MNCLRLRCVCECGGYGHPHSFWITDQKQLLDVAVCVNCEEKLNVIFPLTDLFKSCPSPDIKLLNQAIGQEIEQITEAVDPLLYDEEFAKAIGMKLTGIKFTAP
jgi:hypothetical protein